MGRLPVIETYWETMDERAEMLGVLREVLTEVGSAHALIGGLAVGYHGRRRATVDVDLLVPRRKLGPLARALEKRGHVVRRDPDLLRVYPPGADPESDEAIADLVAREANGALREAARHVERATVLGHSVDVVERGALVALKFHAAISPARRLEDRYQDLADMGRVMTRRFTAEDAALARRVALRMHEGAADELDRMIDHLRRGKKVKL